MPDETQQDSTLPKLRPKQARVVAGIAQGMTVSAATKAAGVNRSTFYIWRANDPLFAASLFQAEGDYVDELNAQVRSLAPEAVATIRRILTDESVNPSVQIKTAIAVLSSAGALSPRGRSGNDDPVECEINIESDKVRRANARNGVEEHRQYAIYMQKRLTDPKRLPVG